MLRKKLILYKSIEEGIKACFGESVTIKDESYVSGGDINVAKCLKLSNDEKIFVKIPEAASLVLQSGSYAHGGEI